MKGVGSGFLALLPLGYNKFKSNQPFGVSDVEVKQLLETADICGSVSLKCACVLGLSSAHPLISFRHKGCRLRIFWLCYRLAIINSNPISHSAFLA